MKDGRVGACLTLRGIFFIGWPPAPSFLIGAGRVAVLLHSVDVLRVGVAADVPEDVVHAQEGGAGADHRVVHVGERVEEGDAGALLQDLIVGRREETVGEAVSGKGGRAVH